MKCKKCGTDMIKSVAKPEWEQQLNILAFLYREHDFPVKRLRINAILRDHMKSKALADRDYPAIPFQTVDIPVWSHDECYKFISNRILLHESVKHNDADHLPPCSASERWTRPDTWAIRKEGRKSAVRVLSSVTEADELLHTLDSKHSIEYRPGASIRCNGYCNVSTWCKQYQLENIDAMLKGEAELVAA